MPLYTPSVVLPPLRAGYHFPISPAASSTAALTQAVNIASPWVVTSTVALTRIGISVTGAGDVNSKVRLGIWADSAGTPGSLVLDAGQIAGDSATVQEITIALTLPAGVYWLSAAAQAVSVTPPTVRVSSNWQSPVDIVTGTSAPTTSTTVCAYTEASVTGAFGSSFTASPSVTGQAPRVFVKSA